MTHSDWMGLFAAYAIFLLFWIVVLIIWIILYRMSPKFQDWVQTVRTTVRENRKNRS